MTDRPTPSSLTGRTARSALMLAALAMGLLVLAPAAHASKQTIDFFGGNGILGGQFSEAAGVAVNYTGAGGVPAGTIYATDGGHPDSASQRGNRVQRFQRDDNGTPGETADDTYFFVAAWGAGVLTGGTDYEICTVATSCLTGAGIGGNGTLAGNGALSKPSGVAVDQDSGEVYVLDSAFRRTPDNNFRINVYSATGTFLRSFGFDVAESGPGNTGTGYEICVAANGDVCKKGTKGSGLGQIGASENNEIAAEDIAVSPPDGTPASGTVFLADKVNRRVNTYDLDGTSPGSIGSAAQFDTNQPEDVAVDSRGILYASNHTGDPFSGQNPIERYDTQGVNGPVGFLAPIASGVNENQQLTVSATAGTFNLTFEGDTTADLPFNASCETISNALRALPSVGGPNLFSFGSLPCTITFFNGLGAKDVPQIIAANGATPLSGGSGASVITTTPGQAGLTSAGLSSGSSDLATDPDSDGPGADTDVLYAGRGSVIQQFGPLNAPGLLAPPGADDDRHGTNGAFNSANGLAVEPPTGRLYATSGGQAGQGVYVLDNAGPPPTATLDSVDGVTANSADLHATIDPNGPPATRYHFEYVDDATFQVSGFSNARSTPEVFLGAQEDPQAIDVTFEPAPIGLEPNTKYHVRLIAVRNFASPIATSALSFITLGVPPLAETAGAPVRTTTTAQLNGRVTPRGNATTYHFEYGTEGPCASSPCTSTLSMPAGTGQTSELVADEITGLQPDTTYHYRLVAENGVGSPVASLDTTVHTRASNQLPGQSDEFPGPPGSDRAWEQVSIADSSGNPVSFIYPEMFSNDGNRAVYGIAGGTPISSVGTLLSLYFSQRTSSGWQTNLITPPRDQLVGQKWSFALGSNNLSVMMAQNRGTDSGIQEGQIWSLAPDSSPSLLNRMPGGEAQVGLSADGSRAVALLRGPLDPNHPAAAANEHVYDIGSATPRLVSLLPGNTVGPCGAPNSFAIGSQDSNWVSEDGSLVYFESRPAPPCSSLKQLYVRDLVAGQTKLISGPPLSGADCGGALIKAIPGAAFFATQSRLDPDDTEAGSCTDSHNDVYRYDLGDGSLACVTCVYPGFDTGVQGSNSSQVAVSEDGSRVYFTTTERLLPDAQVEGEEAIYRVDGFESGDLTYIVSRDNVGTAQPSVGMSADGSVLVFSSASASLNPLGDVSDNGGTLQYYRYDDIDRSLVCVSCPQDGSSPVAGVIGELNQITPTDLNNRALSTDGSTLAFSTATPLVGADQNTPGLGHSPEPGSDVYEWRDGRLILVTDGLTNWTEDTNGTVSAPNVAGVGPAGKDIYFIATAAYTPDAPDALMRLYTARIGGGIHFPKPPPPCPLEVCQGIPKGAPEEQEPASSNFSGPGNQTQTPPRLCPKGKRKVNRGGKSRCVKKQRPRKQRRAANHNRRANR